MNTATTNAATIKFARKYGLSAALHDVWTRSDTYLLVFCTAAFLGLDNIRRLAGASRDSVAPVLLEMNAGKVLVFAAVLTVLSASDALLLSAVDLVVIGAGALFMAPSVSNLEFLGATLVGVYLLISKPSGSKLFCVGQLWVAISIYEIWGKLLFRVVFSPTFRPEAGLIAALGSYLGLGTTHDGIVLSSSAEWSVYIAEPCSSFHNISLSIVVWLALLRISGEEKIRPHLKSLFVGMAGVMCLNTARILIMSRSEEQYIFWHDGAGATIFSVVSLIVVTTPTMVSLRGRR